MIVPMLDPAMNASDILSAEVKSAAVSAAEADIPLMSTSEVQALLTGLDAATQQELLSIYNDSYLIAFSAALLFLALMAGIGFFIARRLPATRLVEDTATASEEGIVGEQPG